MIEHFVEPDKNLLIINNLMAENGILYIITPDLYKFKKPFSQFCIPHTFYFSRKTLENLLLKHGFRVEKYFDNLISNETILLTKKERKSELIKYDRNEYKKVLVYLKKNRILFIFLKLKRFAEEIFIKIFGENIYLKIRCFFKNLAITLIKKHRKQ